MNFPFYFLIFIFGLIVGSFLNCLIYRLEIGKVKDRGFLAGRSYCPHCRHNLSWQDLIPIFSFLSLSGKCRYCTKKISWQYPLVELATGILFLLIFNYQFSFSGGFLILNLQNLLFFGYWLLVSCFLIVIFVYDLKHYIIPDRVIYPAIFISGVWYFASFVFFHFYTKQEIINVIYSALGSAIFFLLIVLISWGKGMGIGDIKLGFFMGLVLGWPNVAIALFSAFLIGAIIGVGLILLNKKKFSSQVPFGPFLVTGTLLALFLGEFLTNWYFNLFI